MPIAYALCQDESVVGSDFYIMEFLDGRIFEDPAIPGVTPEERTKMSVQLPAQISLYIILTSLGGTPQSQLSPNSTA